MQRFFIADIHLNHHEPAITAGFLDFLIRLPDHSELYILGDLFDYWIGDDLVDDLALTVAQALKQLKARGIQTYFIAGNRDFLLGQRFAKRCAMQILPEIELLTGQGDQRLLILHGDLLCTHDVAYQKFRRKMHNPWLQKLFLWLPRAIRQKIATKLRQQSHQHNQQKQCQIMDVNQTTVVAVMNRYQASMMIHGHTHKPARHSFLLAGKPATRMVLGAWHDGVNYLHQEHNGAIKWIHFPN